MEDEYAAPEGGTPADDAGEPAPREEGAPGEQPGERLWAGQYESPEAMEEGFRNLKSVYERHQQEVADTRARIERLEAQRTEPQADPEVEKQGRLVELYHEQIADLQAEGYAPDDEQTQQLAAQRARREMARQEREEKRWQERFGRLEQSFERQLESVGGDAAYASVLKGHVPEGVTEQEVAQVMREQGTSLTQLREFERAGQLDAVASIMGDVAFARKVRAAQQRARGGGHVQAGHSPATGPPTAQVRPTGDAALERAKAEVLRYAPSLKSDPKRLERAARAAMGEVAR